jgi:hypothetical protein
VFNVGLDELHREDPMNRKMIIYFQAAFCYDFFEDFGNDL